MNGLWTSERIESELGARSTQDIAAVVLVTTLCSLLAIHFEWTERLFAWTRQWESLELDEMAFVFLVLALGLAWFSLRRWQEARTALVVRLEQELPGLLGTRQSANAADARGEADDLIHRIQNRMRALQGNAIGLFPDTALQESTADVIECTDRLRTLLR